MTQFLELINAGVDYGTGDVLPAADVNLGIANTELAWSSAAAHMSPSVWISSGWSSVGKWVGDCMQALALDSGTTYSVKTSVTGDTVSGAVADIVMATEGAMTICYNGTAATWGAWPLGASVHSYLSDDATLAAWTQSTGVSFRALAAVSVGTSYLVAGATATTAAVRRYTAATMVLGATYASAYSGAEFSDIASNGTTGLVAVTVDAVSWSANTGATWSEVALTKPTGASGYPSVNWLASLSLYVCSYVLDTGVLAYSTSSTGATWTAWQVTDQVAIAPDQVAATSAPMAGIVAVGATLVAPRVNAARQLGVLLSTDSGASWRAADGGAHFNTLDYLRTIVCGNRVAFSSINTVAFTGCVTGEDKANSAAL